MATSVVAYGKLEIAARRGQPVPEGWAIDGEGRPLTDPASAGADTALLPLGGSPLTGAFKGFGLAIMVDLLSSALAGVVSSAEERPQFAAAHFFGALRVDGSEPIRAAEVALFDRAGSSIQIDSADDATALLLCGEPIGEPVVGHGPFVMNRPEEIRQAIADYQGGRMGRLT